MPVSLLDIAPRDERRQIITIDGKELEIRGLSVGDLGKLCKRFPDLRIALFNKNAPEDVQTAGMLEAWPAIIAAGVGKLGDAEFEAAADRMPHSQLLAIGAAVMKLTNPEAEEIPLSPEAKAVLDQALAAAAASTANMSSAEPSSS
jgi:hypothetical protein